MPDKLDLRTLINFCDVEWGLRSLLEGRFIPSVRG